jgi:hypothetical protein
MLHKQFMTFMQCCRRKKDAFNLLLKIPMTENIVTLLKIFLVEGFGNLINLFNRLIELN